MAELEQTAPTLAAFEALDVAPVFTPFPSIPRLSRDIVVTEKIDGTNASVTILESGRVIAGSRSRYITPQDDNFGFARFVSENEDEFRKLGPGQHFGEWWGPGIQRGYGLKEKRFSLFNTHRWKSMFNTQQGSETNLFDIPLLHVVPEIGKFTFDSSFIDETLDRLRIGGSYAAPGFMQPEGIVVFHAKSNMLFKKTLDKNDGHKGV